jgi:hypothetical protein
MRDVIGHGDVGVLMEGRVEGLVGWILQETFWEERTEMGEEFWKGERAGRGGGCGEGEGWEFI